MLARIVRRGSTFVVALCLLTFGCAMAQSPAVNPTEADYAAQQQQRQVQQPLNNQPVWKEVRSGAAAVHHHPRARNQRADPAAGPDVARAARRP